MRIVVDAMGSDNAPGPEVEGAVNASLLSDDEIILVGDEALLKPAVNRYPKQGKVTVVHASERVLMDESPMLAVRKKKDSSLRVGLRLVKEGNADAFISAGNTGAAMMGSRVVLGPIEGVSRSALCQSLPTIPGSRVVALDLGANVDCTAQHLIDFASMGSIFAQLTLGIESPRVGLANIGEENTKGNETAKTVHTQLAAAEHINFIGNIEPKGMYEGHADVVVCDGFVGNIILKTSEAVAKLIKSMLESEYKASPSRMLGALLSRGVIEGVRKRTDPNEQTGAPLLGVNGIVIILHGSCNHRAVTNAILGARREHQINLNARIREGVAELRKEVLGLGDSEPA